MILRFRIESTILFFRMVVNLEFINTVNRCQIEKLDRVGKQLLSRDTHGWCDIFSEHVRQCQAALIHTYQIIARAAVTNESPLEAARLWRQMSEFCDLAMAKLTDLKEQYPDCGTPELFDLALDYKNASDERYEQNLQDSECLKNTPPNLLFPKTS